MAKRKIKENNTDNEESVIKRQIDEFEKQIDNIQKAVKDVNLDRITDPGQKLDLAKTKITILEKLPKLLQSLKELKLNTLHNSSSIRGETQLTFIDMDEDQIPDESQ